MQGLILRDGRALRGICFGTFSLLLKAERGEREGEDCGVRGERTHDYIRCLLSLYNVIYFYQMEASCDLTYQKLKNYNNNP